jgi:hypothetical protein
MVRVGKSAIGEAACDRFAPVVPTRRISPEVLDQVDDGVSGLPFKLKVSENKVEGRSVRLVEREAIGKLTDIAGHALKHC